MLRESHLHSVDAALLEARDLLGDDDDLVLLRWPDDEQLRRDLATRDVPRLLLVADGTPPPPSLGLCEDWIRLPLDASELLARRAAVLQRATCAEHGPVLDADGLLWWSDRWVAIPPAQVPVVRLLVDRVRRLVRREELLAAYVERGGSDNPVAFKAVLGRLVKRFAQVGLDLRSLRGRGYLLDVPNTCPLHATSAGAAANT